VITVPAYFDESQRQATREAGQIAGLEVVRLLNEPTAAALAYGLQQLQNGVIAIYDLGGGTFDISVLRVTDGVFEVLATNGHTRLGGDDFDRALVEFLLEDIRRRHGTELAGDRVAMQQLRLAAEAAKVQLSSQPRTTVRMSLENLAYHREITRVEFEDRIDPLVKGTLIRSQMALLDAGLAPADVDEVVLVGGSTRVPLVRRRVESLFDRPAHSRLDPDQVVAMGAAVQANILEGGRADMLLLDVTPLSESRPSGAASVWSFRGTPRFLRGRKRRSRRRSMDRRPSPSTWCKASANWPRSVGRWPDSSCAGSDRCPQASPRSRSHFGSMPTDCCEWRRRSGTQPRRRSFASQPMSSTRRRSLA
jgi:actin-like ATPase involved in cell morphogenesis